MALDNDVNGALDRLLKDYDATHPAGSILRCYARAVHELRNAGVQAGLHIAAEAMTRHRLDRRLEMSQGAA